LGIEQLMASPPAALRGQRLGLLCNAASVDHDLIHSRTRVHQCFGDQLQALFSPQHGFYAEKQDNMIESADRLDPELRIPLFSLYSETRKPTRAMFDPIDWLLIDIQDAGTRVYTFATTMVYCMQAARQYGKKVMVLDRPNPIGGHLIEGNCLEPEWRSFVGPFEIPMRHGMTMAELALMFNQHFNIDCDLSVIPMQGWQRGLFFPQTGLHWVAPSPNLPTPGTALVYPGQVIWEGTNVSEGRGTTQPFELFGAPFIAPEKILDDLGPGFPAGATLRPVEFEPTANKWQGRLCRGFQIHVTDPDRFQPYQTSLAVLQAVARCHPADFAWKAPPYEYDWERMPIDLILGSQTLRERLSAMEPIASIAASWRPQLSAYDATRRRYFLYPSH
jgi:uncharacterized protein YbbC (DUF1343 family)